MNAYLGLFPSLSLLTTLGCFSMARAARSMLCWWRCLFFMARRMRKRTMAVTKSSAPRLPARIPASSVPWCPASKGSIGTARKKVGEEKGNISGVHVINGIHAHYKMEVKHTVWSEAKSYFHPCTIHLSTSFGTDLDTCLCKEYREEASPTQTPTAPLGIPAWPGLSTSTLTVVLVVSPDSSS